MSTPATAPRRGMPLVVLALLLGMWVTSRAALWESPFGLPRIDAEELLFAEIEQDRMSPSGIAPAAATIALSQSGAQSGSFVNASLVGPYAAPGPGGYWRGFSALGDRASIAAGHQYLMSAAFKADWHSTAFSDTFAFGESKSASAAATPRRGSAPPFAARPPADRKTPADRWAMDVFAFYRAGSGSLSTSQGRVPVYGANQIAAKLGYRIAQSSGHDPQAFVRAYHALVADPETELATGLSARPLKGVPVRLVGEVRGVRGTAGTDLRPAGYAVAEFAPQPLPLGFSLETYAAAGYVGGKAATYFVDGQGSLTRELVSLDGLGERPMRLSLGGAAWGGAQEDAERLDVGPTMRLDLSVGEVPARLSVDWRQRVAGDAAPDSGVAATVSTRF